MCIVQVVHILNVTRPQSKVSCITIYTVVRRAEREREKLACYCNNFPSLLSRSYKSGIFYQNVWKSATAIRTNIAAYSMHTNIQRWISWLAGWLTDWLDVFFERVGAWHLRELGEKLLRSSEENLPPIWWYTQLAWLLCQLEKVCAFYPSLFFFFFFLLLPEPGSGCQEVLF